MNKAETEIPAFKEPYKLTDEQQRMLDRFKEELDARLGVRVVFDVWTENHLAHPTASHDYVHFQVQAGNWKRQAMMSDVEMDTRHEAFYYFLRRLVDETMADLLKRGAQTY